MSNLQRIIVNISIHAPHEGERLVPPRETETENQHFNPRSPRGGATRPDGATPPQ